MYVQGWVILLGTLTNVRRRNLAISSLAIISTAIRCIHPFFYIIHSEGYDQISLTAYEGHDMLTRS